MLNVSQTAEILKCIEDAKRFVLITHASPDGDALGSTLGLAALLKKKFPAKETLCVCHDPPPPSLRFLPKAETFQQDVRPAGGDLIFFLDAAEPKLTELHETHPRIFDQEKAQEDGIATIKIDHHPSTPLRSFGASHSALWASRDRSEGQAGSGQAPPPLQEQRKRIVDFAMLNLVDAEASSSCEIVVDIAESLAIPISPEAAICLLTGIYTDTGSMMHSNTTARVYTVAATLMRAGADQHAIVQQVFRTSKLSTLRLWGRVLEKIALTEEGGAVSAVTTGDFRATGADFSELTGAIDYLNSIPGMKFSLILSQRNGKVKGSLRTLQEDVDVAAMAQKFSGGGHRKAAGFSINGTLEEETRWKVVPTKKE